MGEPTDTVKSEIETKDISDALSSLSVKQWENINYPVVTHVGSSIFQTLNKENTGVDDKITFWKEAFNPEYFIHPTSQNEFNIQNDVLLVLHSFPSEQGTDSFFRAITTDPKYLIASPLVYLDYNWHGKPCEIKSKSLYPSIDFWDFLDNICNPEQDNYPIPDTGYRKNFVKKFFFTEDVKQIV